MTITKSQVTRIVSRQSAAIHFVKSIFSGKASRSQFIPKYSKSSSGRKVTNSKISGGGALDTTRFKYNQSPVESPDGSRVLFTLPNSDNFESGLVEVFINGNQKIKDNEWQETGTTQITLIGSYATNPPTADETIKLNYIKP